MIDPENGNEAVRYLSMQVRAQAKLLELLRLMANECYLARQQAQDPQPDRAAALNAAQRAVDEAIDRPDSQEA